MAAAVNAGSFECKGFQKTPVTCHLETPIVEVMSQALTNHVHRVWVVDNEDHLNGVVSFSDIIMLVHDYFIRQHPQAHVREKPW